MKSNERSKYFHLLSKKILHLPWPSAFLFGQLNQDKISRYSTEIMDIAYWRCREFNSGNRFKKVSCSIGKVFCEFQKIEVQKAKLPG